jgi:hypothetical protein
VSRLLSNGGGIHAQCVDACICEDFSCEAAEVAVHRAKQPAIFTHQAKVPRQEAFVHTRKLEHGNFPVVIFCNSHGLAA